MTFPSYICRHLLVLTWTRYSMSSPKRASFGLPRTRTIPTTWSAGCGPSTLPNWPTTSPPSTGTSFPCNFLISTVISCLPCRWIYVPFQDQIPLLLSTTLRPSRHEKPFWEQIDSSRFPPVYTKTCLRPKTANSSGTIYLLFIFLARARRGYSKAFIDIFINWIGMMYDDF